MNRREAFRIIGAGALTGGLAAGAVAAVLPASAASPVSADLAAAIEAHRATIRHDESLYDDDCQPLVDDAALEASDGSIAAAFAIIAAIPCRTPQDVAEKVRYILAGSDGLRGNADQNEFLNLLLPDGFDLFDPAGPFLAFMRSLLPPDVHA